MKRWFCAILVAVIVAAPAGCKRWHAAAAAAALSDEPVYYVVIE